MADMIPPQCESCSLVFDCCMCDGDMQGSNPERSMQLEKMRIIMDRDGIKRLEPGGAGVLTKRARHGQKGVVQPVG